MAVVGARRQGHEFLAGRAFLKESDIVDYVKHFAPIGSTVMCWKDVYNSDKRTEKAPRKIIGFYPHYVLTMDEIGRRECWGWFDMYCFVKGESSEAGK